MGLYVLRSSICNHKCMNADIFFCCSSDDFSRVKLNKIKGEEGSDYINASFVDVRQYSHCYLNTLEAEYLYANLFSFLIYLL